ncbi:S9 family peptidase [Polymorphobacter sp. PAMC 29334]|uniref:alpha/beta hydrolase family protein n=1 Tax=Polymorphobacter sp. PAMC 29334 TaxID=2862331 RepID=UPI001C6668C5|nr:S9 family peptidase [Polymorphobacter sp. PAMC 29334]QYE36603.1 S9 family peptidase [Polymorphobacter sp. PAMC 29334]
MIRFSVWLGLAALGAAFSAAAVPPIEAYGHLPSVDMIEISPDGSKLALFVGDEHNRQIQVRSTADMKVLLGAKAGDTKVRALMWAGENHLLITTSTTAWVYNLSGNKREYLQIVDFDLAKHKPREVLNGVVTGVSRLLNTAAALPTVRMIGGKPIAFVEGISFPDRAGVLTLIRDDLETANAREIALGTVTTRGWVLDQAGQIVARVDYDDKPGEWTLSTGHDGHLVRSMRGTYPIDVPAVRGFGRDANTILVGFPGDEIERHREVALGGDHPSEPIEVLDDGDPVHDSRTGVVIGVRHTTGLGVSYSFFAPEDARLWTQVTKAFPNAVVELASWSDDHHKIVLKVEGGKFGAAFFLLDTATHHAAWLADEYREISGDDIFERKLISYPAADGLPIPAYLTLPAAHAGAKLPLIVLAHGGPGARDEAGFDWWSQALASRGYAVLQPEFRGSTGFGEHFHAAGYGEWGRKMQTDLSDGVKFLAAAGTIDPARACIVGASYGGYAALAGVTLQSGVYACAVSLAGPSDLRPMLATEQAAGGGVGISLRFWQRFMGASSRNDPALDLISPAKQAAKVTVPVLLIHGIDDTVVLFAQSKTMAAALTRAGRPTEVVTLKGEDHWLSHSETRTAMLKATVDFLGVNLPAGTP